MPGERRKRRQQTRYEGGESVVKQEIQQKSNQNNEGNKKSSDCTNVAVAEKKEFESVSIMPSSTPDAETCLKKYQRRPILSNWSRYEGLPDYGDDCINDGEDYLIGEDFAEILQRQRSNKGGYLHLKGEVSWGEEDKSLLSNHGLGAVRISDIVNALQTVPLHMQLNIPEEDLPEKFVKHSVKTAEENEKKYKPNQNYVTDLNVNKLEIKNLCIDETDTLRLLNKSSQVESKLVDKITVMQKFAKSFSLNSVDNENQDEISAVNFDDSFSKANSLDHVSSNTLQEITSSTSSNVVALNKKKKNEGINFGFSKQLIELSVNPDIQSQAVCDDAEVKIATEGEETMAANSLETKEIKCNEPESSTAFEGNVCIINSDEKKVLEDWLDSVLDD